MEKAEFLAKLKELGLEELFGLHLDEIQGFLSWMFEEDVDASEVLDFLDSLEDSDRDRLRMVKP